MNVVLVCVSRLEGFEYIQSISCECSLGVCLQARGVLSTSRASHVNAVLVCVSRLEGFEYIQSISCECYVYVYT